MTLSFVLPAAIRQLFPGRQLLIYAASWTALLTVTVAVASFAPEMAFVWAISPSSGFSRACGERDDAVRIPLGGPGEVLCFPAMLFRRSTMDLFVPPAFAAVIVAAAAFVVRAFGLWEDETDSLL